MNEILFWSIGIIGVLFLLLLILYFIFRPKKDEDVEEEFIDYGEDKLKGAQYYLENEEYNSAQDYVNMENPNKVTEEEMQKLNSIVKEV